MNEELIKQCVDEAINPEDYPAEGGYRTAQDGCAFAIRLYHARRVAPLVETLREARAALHQHYVDWDGEPEDAVPLQLARSKCDAALAPFQQEARDAAD